LTVTFPTRALRAPSTQRNGTAVWSAISSPVLVHDYLLVKRGAERTFLSIADEWPDAPIRTLLFDASVFGDRLRGHAIGASRLQRLRIRQGTFRAFLPVYPFAAERLDVGGSDLVISSSSAFAHGVHPATGAMHVCYCHSPFRYVWHEAQQLSSSVPPVLRPAVSSLTRAVRQWDRNAASRVTHFIANSKLTQERIAQYWQRDSAVLHPPVEVDRFAPASPEGYALLVGELVHHKRFDLALEAARMAGMPAKVAGAGPDADRLRHLYPDAEFTGRVDDATLERLYARATVLIVPNVEEFGIAAVEAQAAGRPVLAAGRGGATETVVDGVTGVLFPPGDLDALTDALRNVDFERFDSSVIVQHARRFSPQAFRCRLRAEIDRLWPSGRLVRPAAAAG
jgi:glycosyltransferase involved in cell wall biosynthesis